MIGYEDHGSIRAAHFNITGIGNQKRITRLKFPELFSGHK